MSKDVNFRISLNIDGRQVLVQCKTDAQELAAQLGQVKSRSDIARQAIMKWSSLSTALQNAYQGAQQVAGVMNTYIQKANAAKESQVKLTTVMRQRMDAEKSDIDTINSLIAKQTELGVVGGTVQRSGLQQLATFASQRSTLETLLPAMNNLLVQQNGLNVSSESAVGVANLMGKALMGNYSALKRVGITFTDTQAQLIKTGDEGTRAATIAQVITQNVGNMNAEMAKTDAGRAKQAANELGGLQVKIGQFFSQYQEVIMLMGQTGATVSGIWSLVAGIKAVAQSINLSTVAARANTIASKIAAAIQFLWAKQLRYATQAQIAWAFSAKLATVQAIAMRAAILGLMAVTGVGIAVAAVAGIISLFASKTGDTVEALGDASSAMTSADRVANQYKEAMKGISSSVSSEEQKLDTLNDTLNDNNAKLKDKQKALAEIKSLVPQVNATIDSEGKVHGDASSAIATHIRMLKALQKALAAYNAGQKIKNEQSENELALEVAKDKYNRSSRTLEKIRADYYKNENGKYFETNYSSAGLSYNVPTKLGRGALNMMGDAYKDMQTAQKEMTAAQIKVTESSQDVITAENFYKKKLIQQAKEAGVTSKEIDKAIRESNGDWAKATSILFNRNETPTADTTSTTKTGRSGKADTKIFNSAAVTTKEISDNISVLQEKLSKTDPKTEKYKAISDAIKVWQERLDDINRGYELGSIADYEAQISKVDSQLKNLNLKEEERNALIKQREELQQKADALSNANVEKGSLDDLNNQMQKLQKQFNATGSLEARLKIKAEINDLQAQIDAQTDGKLTIPAETEPTYIEPGSEADKRRSYQNAQSKAQGIQSDVQSGVIDTATAEKRIKELNGQLQSLGLQPINIDLNIDTSQIDEAANIIKDLAGSFGGTASSITNQFEGLALSFNDIAKKAQEAKKNSDGTGQSFNATAAYAAAGAAGVAALGDAMQQAGADGAAAKIGATLAAIGQIALGFASAAASPAVTSTGWGWLAFVGAGLAAMAVAISTIQSYATGGIVGGSSYTGDKLTAHVNSGEMILNMQQQRRLFAIANGDVTPKITLPTYNNRAMLNTTGLNGGGMVDLSGIDWRLRGPDIVAAVANTTRIGARSGRKSNIAV